MTIEIVTQQQDETNPLLWYFKISGPDTATGTIRLADLSKETSAPADWLASHPAEAQAAIDAGVVSDEFNERRGLGELAQKINNELTWLAGVHTDIASGIAIIDSPATLAQLRNVVKGLAQIVDRLASEQEEELKSWRYVVRRLK